MGDEVLVHRSYKVIHMNKRVQVMRFSDGILKLMAKEYPDFKGCLYEYNGSCIVMAIVASIQEGLQKLTPDQSCSIIITEKLLQNCFDLMDVDLYDYSAFDDMDIKFSYIRNGEKVRLPLITKLNPTGNCLELTLNPDFYQVLQTADTAGLDGQEVLEKCKSILQSTTGK